MGFISTNNLNLSFRLSMDYYTSIAVFDEKDRLILKNNLIKSEQNHGLNKLGEEGIYSYNHPDYLYLYATLNNLRNNYNMNYDTDFLSMYFSKEKLIKENIYSDNKKYKLPYVHIEMDPYYRGIASSSITNWGTEKDVIYKIKFNYEILRKYLDFLIKLFDPLYNNENKEKDKQCFFITINDELRNDELRKTLLNYFKKGYPYIKCIVNDDRELLIKNLKGQGINNKFLIGAVPDIYLKEGFEYFCTDIENLISSLYDNSIKAIIAHELAHISNGHNDMKYYNPDLFQDNFSLQHLLEYDADTTALRWILFEDFMNGLNGPFDTKLNIKMDDLVESLKLKVVSYYLALRWNYIEDNKSWNEDLIKKVIESESFKTHPLYQLRIFQMLTNAFDRLDKMLELSQKDKITTIDGKSLTKNIILNIKDDILNMIGSFESVFVFKNKNMNTDDIILKFTKIIKLVEGDMKKCFKLWPEISRILQEYNYCKLNKYNIE